MENTEIHEAENAFIKNASARVKFLIGKAHDIRTNKQIERTFDIIHASPSKSDYSVRDIEQDINSEISSLERAVAANENNTVLTTLKNINELVESRNLKLREKN